MTLWRTEPHLNKDLKKQNIVDMSNANSQVVLEKKKNGENLIQVSSLISSQEKDLNQGEIYIAAYWRQISILSHILNKLLG